MMLSRAEMNERNKTKQGEKLKRIRKEKGLTQKETASILGVSQSRYSNYENGYATIPLDILSNFCKVFTVEKDKNFPERKSDYKSIYDCVENLMLSDDFTELRSAICSIEDKRKRREFAMEYMDLTREMLEKIEESNEHHQS